MEDKTSKTSDTMEPNQRPFRNFSLDSFKQAMDGMVTQNDTTYQDIYNRYLNLVNNSLKDYSLQEINQIIKNGEPQTQSQLSRTYYAKDGFYKRIILYYSALLKYSGITIPNPSYGKSLQTEHIAKRYYQAVDFVDRIDLKGLFTRFSFRALVDGTYYGVIQSLDKSSLTILDLPFNYCRTRFKDENGTDIIEFNVAYFNTILSPKDKKAALATYPNEIAKYYKAWVKSQNVATQWVIVPTDIGLCFQFFDGRPLFLQVLPATLSYNETVSREAERELEEIKKIIIQKIPHLNDGTLLFEPDEAQEMHNGSVGMLKKSNPNVSVLTTYADVDSIVSKSNQDTVGSNNIEKMKNHIYNEAGASSQLFSAAGTASLEASVKNDLSLMMILGNKYSTWLTGVINRLYANTNITFKYNLLPISWYNESEYVDQSLRMATSGYSLLIPAIAQGFSQKDLSNLKDLENDTLDLVSKLIPLQTSFTQSGNEDTGGRPEKPIEKKSDKTIANKESQDKNGGGA
jgi:hypothetical protein